MKGVMAHDYPVMEKDVAFFQCCGSFKIRGINNLLVVYVHEFP